MEEYRSNSHRSREAKKESIPEKKIEKVISGAAKSKKKSGIRKFASAFVPEDVDGDVMGYILEDIIVPAVKDIILDAVKAVLGVNGNRKSHNSPASKVRYQKYYDDRDRRDTNVTKVRNGYEYDDIIIDNRGEAEDVLSRMDELIDTYGVVSVADFYDLVGITGNYTDNKYGWTDIRSATVVRAGRDGYMIKLPKALPLN